MTPLGTTEFLIVYGACALSILLCRTLPLFVLKERELPPRLEQALHLIPPAAFAALVANDLFKPDMFSTGFWPEAIPLVAALIVVVVAQKTHSLLWCGIAGVAAYALLSLIQISFL